MKFNTALAALSLIVLTGCQTTTPPPPPKAVIDISTKTCVDSWSTENAVDLTPEKSKKWKKTYYAVDNESECLDIDGQSGNYKVFALPDHASNHVITIGGRNQEIRTLATQIMLLDEAGNKVRVLDAKTFMNRGGDFSTQFKPRDGEVFVLVMSDPDRVGKDRGGNSDERRIKLSLYWRRIQCLLQHIFGC